MEIDRFVAGAVPFPGAAEVEGLLDTDDLADVEGPFVQDLLEFADSECR
ncbi:hypothetical protein [Salinispora arenicola]|nr:hypothetical protein [Salinispora arenicola]NIL64704.1 hypothetical protein [Salinispora arenicola]